MSSYCYLSLATENELNEIASLLTTNYEGAMNKFHELSALENTLYFDSMSYSVYLMDLYNEMKDEAPNDFYIYLCRTAFTMVNFGDEKMDNVDLSVLDVVGIQNLESLEETILLSEKLDFSTINKLYSRYEEGFYEVVAGFKRYIDSWNKIFKEASDKKKCLVIQCTT